MRRLQGVLTAQQYTLLEYNVPRKKLKEAEKIPGIQFADDQRSGRPELGRGKVMVPKKKSIEIMDKLEASVRLQFWNARFLNCRL